MIRGARRGGRREPRAWRELSVPGRLRGSGMLLLPALLLVLTACDRADSTGEGPAAEDAAAYIRPSAEGGRLVSGDTLPEHPSWTEEDWTALEEAVTHARREGIDTLPVGERIAALGRRFVGTPYVPRTLDPPGPERLVINLRALDCVTFVEAMMTLAHFLERAPEGIVQDRDRAIGLYEEILTSIRYRNGTIDGYPSRLHYFTEWLRDNAEKGYVRIVTEELGGIEDPAPIHFMTSHRDAYDQLVDPTTFEAIGRIEERLSATPRHYIPQNGVAGIQDGIRTGDVIAATSTLDGLDVAHTGIALWEDGVLKLMHAPLVGEAVQISERPLAERLLGLSAQDGIMVARPLEASHPEEIR